MNTFEIIYTSVIISLFISLGLTGLDCHFRDKEIAELKDELGKTRARLDNLERFTFELSDHYRDHLRGHRY